MRRWLCLFLLVFLPLQASWAAAGSYCQHESGADAQHFGHHEHHHQDKASQEGKAKPFKPGLAVDGDCDACHSCCGAILIESQALPKVALVPVVNGLNLQRLRSVISARPERPNWTDREQFGGAVYFLIDTISI